MKRFKMKQFIAGVIWVLAVVGLYAYSLHTQPGTGDVGRYFNTSGQQLLKGHFVKPDSTWAKLGIALDTTQYLHQWTDTSATTTGFGNCSTYQGTDNKKALLTDTLRVQTGNEEPFNVKAYPNAASSTDSIILSGWGYPNTGWFGGDSSQIIDTLVWTGTSSTERLSQYAWYNIDSVRFALSEAGLDCVQVYYKPIRQITTADSLTTEVLGVVMGAHPRGTATGDTIQDDNWGYVQTSGIANVWMDASSRDIDVGDLIMVGSTGKGQKAWNPVRDTMRTSAAINVRYLQGARTWDAVQLQQIGAGLTSGTTAGLLDSTKWMFELVTDSLRVIQYAVGAAAIATDIVDSLSYEWVPRGLFEKAFGAPIVGKALLPAMKDSVFIPMQLYR